MSTLAYYITALFATLARLGAQTQVIIMLKILDAPAK
jgi:hypothetical protein